MAPFDAVLIAKTASCEFRFPLEVRIVIAVLTTTPIGSRCIKPEARRRIYSKVSIGHELIVSG
jgi:hypothetical protein